MDRLSAFVACIVVVAAGCSGNTKPPPKPPDVGPAMKQTLPADVKIPVVRFTDITREAGIAFHHVNGAFGKKLLPETMGSGVAVLDFDNDGRPDLLFVNSCYWPGHEDTHQPRPTLALYRNLGGNKFEDVTKA